MRRGKWSVVLALVVAVAAVAAAYAAEQAKREGTYWKELAAQKLPAPSGLSVAVLPFGVPTSSIVLMPRTQAERQVEVPRACVLLNVQRHGFKIVPEAASLSLVPALTDKAMALEIEDKVPVQWDREKAVGIGRKLGADWIVYGDLVLDMDYRVTGGLFARVKKVVRLKLHLILVDVQSGEVLYWSRAEAEAQGSSTSHGVGNNAEDAEIARGLFVGTTNSIIDDIAKALPKHEVGPEVTREQLEKLIGAMGL